jgi:hypothetical protein
MHSNHLLDYYGNTEKKRHDITFDFFYTINQRLPDAYNRSPGFQFNL